MSQKHRPSGGESPHDTTSEKFAEVNQKSFVIFVNAIKSEKTRKGYVRDLNEFLKFTKVADYNTLAKLGIDTIQEFLEDYVLFLKKQNLSSIRTRLGGPELFFDMNKKLYYKKILHKLLPSDDNIASGNTAFTNDDILKLLSNTFKPRTKFIIHFLASTGIRPGAFSDPPLQIKHLEKIEDCYSVQIYDGSRENYYAFLTPECVESMNQYFTSRKLNGEKLTKESYIFHTYDTEKKQNDFLSGEGARMILKNLIKKAGISRDKINSKNYDKAAIYGFRKRFYTTLKLNNEINNNVIEKLLGHKRGLEGTYLTPTRNQSFIEFKKGIPELTIDPTKRQGIELEEQQKKITELSKRDDTIQELSKKVEAQQQRLDKIDREDQLIRELGKLEEKINNGIKNKISDEELSELMEKRDRVEKEHNKLAYGEE